MKSEMLKKNPPVTFALHAVSTLLPLSLAAQQIDRTVLPVPEPQPPIITELDLRNVFVVSSLKANRGFDEWLTLPARSLGRYSRFTKGL